MIPPHAGRDRLPAHNEAILRNFNPPAPCGAGPLIPRPVLDTVTFQSTRPLWGGTGCLGKDVGRRKISIHPPLAGRDPKRSVIVIVFVISIHPPRAVIDDARNISIHPPLAGRDPAADRVADRRALISIHPPLAGRDAFFFCVVEISRISIHPPLAGRDVSPGGGRRARCISIHPPLAGRDWRASRSPRRSRAFQSTRPLRGGTFWNTRVRDTILFQSTRPLRGGTGMYPLSGVFSLFQSTRPLRGGTGMYPRSGVFSLFQSTRPLRGGTGGTDVDITAGNDFNPPAPCGAGRSSR